MCFMGGRRRNEACSFLIAIFSNKRVSFSDNQSRYKPEGSSRMRLSGKQKITLGALAGYLITAIVDPLVTIARLNVESWASENGYDKLYKLLSAPPEWMVTLWEALTGSFGLGFVLGALLFAFWDPIAKYGSRFVTSGKRAHRALDELFAEGVRHRNRLLVPIKNYDDVKEREMLGDWSDRVVQELDSANVPIGPRSRFRTLNLFEPQHSPVAGRPLEQVKLEAIWNEKLNRLRAIVDDLGTR